MLSTIGSSRNVTDLAGATYLWGSPSLFQHVCILLLKFPGTCRFQLPSAISMIPAKKRMMTIFQGNLGFEKRESPEIAGTVRYGV